VRLLVLWCCPGSLLSLRRQEPSIEIEIVASNSLGNLLKRDADIAIRMTRPQQLDLVMRHIGDIPLVPAPVQTTSPAPASRSGWRI
jgi:DNA-binding transcriptional LysR family regulator